MANTDSKAPLPPAFYDRDPIEVARDLLGKELISDLDGSLTAGLILETEAYLAEGDPACHAARGPRPRHRSMYGEPGTLYVYAIHAKYCLNAVTEAEGRPSAILIRAIEPTRGLVEMQRRRARTKIRDLTYGPARLCQALGVSTAQDGITLCTGKSVWITEGVTNESLTIEITPRIGISRGQELMLRFVSRH
jgi:DNA-3-methyladenine glycosylase